MKISKRSFHRVLPLALLCPVGAAVALEIQGPSSSQTPYLIASAPGVVIKSIQTVGDSVNLKPDGTTPYRMIGIPDGLGAFKNHPGQLKDGDDDEDEDEDGRNGLGGTFTLLMNHEISNNVTAGLVSPVGVTRAHGNAGAFVSQWTIRKSDLSVEKVEDFLPSDTSIYLSNNYPTAGTKHTAWLPASTTLLTRLCSADLGGPGAHLFKDHGKTYGTSALIFESGEESGGIYTGFAAGSTGSFGPEAEIHVGRQFAFVATDDPDIPGNQARTAYELPHAGLFAWENNDANPLSQRKTIVVGMDDTSPAGQVYVWVGEKQSTGNVVERAGLSRKSDRDNLYAVKVNGLVADGTGATNEDRSTPLSGSFSLVNEGDVSALTAAQLETLSDSKGATQFLRPEDGSWDPEHPSDFYFVTTDRYDQVKDGVGSQIGRSRLYRLRFTDISKPELGGTIAALLDGTETGNMFDNITVNHDGQVLIQEDVGGQAHSGKIWLYDTDTDTLTQIAKHDPTRFGDIGVPATAPFNNDEESSGIIDASKVLGKGWYLLDVQAHYATTGELVEGGQLLAMYVPPKIKMHK
jgi:hypothetical protein